MKRVLIITSLIISAMADTPKIMASECKLDSEHYANISISISKQKEGWRLFTGTLRYKGKPLYAIESQLGNGYPTQYYSFGKLHPTSEHIEREEVLGSGAIITFVGNQIARGTPKRLREKSKPIKVLFIDLARIYFYSLEEERFNPNRSTRSHEILSSLEGLFIGSEKCDKDYFVYAW